MKEIMLAGGSGTRLYPVTKSISKQIIYYPLSVLTLAEIKDILIISTPYLFLKIYNERGVDFGVNFNYTIQKEPNGLAEAFLIEMGKQFY